MNQTTLKSVRKVSDVHKLNVSTKQKVTFHRSAGKENVLLHSILCKD